MKWMVVLGLAAAVVGGLYRWRLAPAEPDKWGLLDVCMARSLAVRRWRSFRYISPLPDRSIRTPTKLHMKMLIMSFLFSLTQVSTRERGLVFPL